MGVTLANAPQSQNSEPADSLPPSNGDSRPSPNQSHYILVLGQRLAETDGKKVATRTSTDRATAAAQAFHDAIEKDSAPGRRPKILLLGGDAASIGVTESELAKALLLGGSADKVTEINGVPVSLEDEDWKSPFPGEISEEDLLLDVRSRFTYTNAIEGVKKMIGRTRWFVVMLVECGGQAHSHQNHNYQVVVVLVGMGELVMSRPRFSGYEQTEIMNN